MSAGCIHTHADERKQAHPRQRCESIYTHSFTSMCMMHRAPCEAWQPHQLVCTLLHAIEALAHSMILHEFFFVRFEVLLVILDNQPLQPLHVLMEGCNPGHAVKRQISAKRRIMPQMMLHTLHKAHRASALAEYSPCARVTGPPGVLNPLT